MCVCVCVCVCVCACVCVRVCCVLGIESRIELSVPVVCCNYNDVDNANNTNMIHDSNDDDDDDDDDIEKNWTLSFLSSLSLTHQNSRE